MTTEQSLLSFVAAVSLLILTPGVDTALVLRTATMDGTKAAVAAGSGIVTGLLAWGSAVALGLGGLIAASQTAYTALKWVGAAYLFYLGLKLLFKPRQGLEPATENSVDRSPCKQEGVEVWFIKGFLTNILNPKVGVFYATFLPQFVPANTSVTSWSFFLAAIHVLLCLIWFAVLIAASVPLGHVLRRPRIVKNLDRLTGGIFVAFGTKLILSKNS